MCVTRYDVHNPGCSCATCQAYVKELTSYGLAARAGAHGPRLWLVRWLNKWDVQWVKDIKPYLNHSIICK